MTDNDLVFMLAATQLIIVTAFCCVLVFGLRSGDQDEQGEHDDDQDDDGGSDRRHGPPRPPGGDPPSGPPLPESMPSRVRLREPRPLPDRHFSPARRAPREPHRPRVPSTRRAATRP